MSDQVHINGWLIEGAGVYWCGKSVHDFRPSWAEAVMFTRRQDAERVLFWVLPEEYRRTCRAAEHLIIGPQ